MKRLLKQLVVHTLVPCLALYGTMLPARAAGREVVCESSGMRRTFCGTGPHGDIRLISNQGRWECRQNETWGTEPEGIWVDQNCRGRFSVDEPARDGGGSNKTGAIVAGVIGLGVLAAIASHNNRRDEDRPPDHGRPDDGYDTWMIGRYQGYAYRDRQNLTFDIGPSGRVTSRGDGEPSYGRILGRGDQMVFDNGVRFYIERTRGGVRLTQVQDRNHVIDLQRIR